MRGINYWNFSDVTNKCEQLWPKFISQYLQCVAICVSLVQVTDFTQLKQKKVVSCYLIAVKNLFLVQTKWLGRYAAFFLWRRW